MPKRASVRKKGIQLVVPRHRVGSKKIAEWEGSESHEAKDGKFLGFRRSRYFSHGKKCFERAFTLCGKFHLIGFTRTQSGEYVLLDRKKQILHYAVIALYLAVLLRNTLGTTHLLLAEGLRVETILCVALSAVYVVPIVANLGALMRPKESIDLLNSWSYVSSSLDVVDSRIQFHPLHDNSACLKVISLVYCTYGVTAAAALGTIIMDNLPICLFPMADSFGLIPDGILPRVAWRVLFAPLEWLMYLPPMLVAQFLPSTLFMGNAAVKIYMEKLRGVPVNCVRSRGRLERMYVQLELFNRIYQVWIRFYFPPWLLSYAVGTIVTLFVTIRYTHLPFIVYIIFPYTTVTMLILIFWQSFDMVRVIRGSEDVLGVLLQQHAPYLMQKTRKERVELTKRARVLRPMTFPVGYSEFSLSLPVNTWEEIINQTLFLLSL